jgi:hypothetical protein
MDPTKTIRTWSLGKSLLGILAIVLSLPFGLAAVIGLVSGDGENGPRALVCGLAFAGVLFAAGVFNVLKGFVFSCAACKTRLAHAKAKVTADTVSPLWLALSVGRVEPAVVGSVFRGHTKRGSLVVTYDHCPSCFAYGRIVAAAPTMEVRALDVGGDTCRAIAEAVAGPKK